MARREALFYSNDERGKVRCELCPHFCEIAGGQKGRCGARANIGGFLYAKSFARVRSAMLDPIEKKPLKFFRPGGFVLSVGTFGCNMDCPFCQNHETVRLCPDAECPQLLPDELAKLAKRYASMGNIGVAYTYNEPLVGYEYVCECAKLVHGIGLSNVLVTNGFINKEPLEQLLPYIDAMNIDLKGFQRDFYCKLGGSLDTVKESIALARSSCHVEVTMLVVPGENDCDAEAAAAWLAEIDRDMPLHITRFFPRHKYAGKTPTPIETLQNAASAAKKYLTNVVIGNV